ncbi:TIGR04255 family protein [Sphingomonas sp. ABOLG]|nr:TIGR04255 family protein [Sphingomonas sp. ABOLG]
MASYRPVSGAHAIEQAVVGVRISGATTDAVYSTAVVKAAELAAKSGLPGRVQLDPLSLLFGRQVISPGYSAAEMTPGTVFQRVEPDGSMAEELTLERNAVTFRTHRYKRWADMVAHITTILSPVASVLAENNAARVSVVELRCVDRFVSDTESIPPLSDLVRQDSPYVTGDMIDRETFLHLHSGWIDDQSDLGRTLYNLNIEIGMGEHARPNATILQVISKQSSGKGSLFADGADFESSVMSTFQDLHLADKALLSKLLSDRLQADINLPGSTGLGVT